MKEQSTVFGNESREEPLEYLAPKRLSIKVGDSKEFLTRQGKVIIVVHKRQAIAGVGDSNHYQINDGGKILQPFTHKGVINYIKR